MFLKKLIIGFVATAIPSFAQGKILVVGGTQTNQKNLAAYTQDHKQYADTFDSRCQQQR